MAEAAAKKGAVAKGAGAKGGAKKDGAAKAAAPKAPAAAPKPTRSGVERAAILLLTLGETEAAEILRHMGAKEVQQLGKAMSDLANVSREEVSKVLGDFNSSVERQTSVGVGGEDFVRKVLVNALGEDKAATLMDRIPIASRRKGLEALKWMDPKSVAEIMRNEHPQIVSIVLSYLDPDQAAEVLNFMPEDMRSDLMIRVATMDGVRPSALSELDEMIEKSFSGVNSSKTSTMGGPKVAAAIMNLVKGEASNSILNDLAKVDEGLSQKIQDLMFIFDDLLKVDDRGMQELLRQVAADKLLIALKGADDALKAKIFKNMSQRAAEMMKDDLEAKGPVKLSEVEAAQKEILVAARKLADAGTISLGSAGGEQYV
jgi:flagellar motor switch protein FliG